MMDVGNDCVGVRSIALKLRNNDVGVHNALMNVGNNYICVYHELGLETDSWRWSTRMRWNAR